MEKVVNKMERFIWWNSQEDSFAIKSAAASATVILGKYILQLPS